MRKICGPGEKIQVPVATLHRIAMVIDIHP